MRYAQIIDGKVVSITIWTGELLPLSDDSPVGIDWDYDGTEFEDNRPVPEVVVPDE